MLEILPIWCHITLFFSKQSVQLCFPFSAINNLDQVIQKDFRKMADEKTLSTIEEDSLVNFAQKISEMNLGPNDFQQILLSSLIHPAFLKITPSEISATLNSEDEIMEEYEKLKEEKLNLIEENRSLQQDNQSLVDGDAHLKSEIDTLSNSIQQLTEDSTELINSNRQLTIDNQQISHSKDALQGKLKILVKRKKIFLSSKFSVIFKKKLNSEISFL